VQFKLEVRFTAAIVVYLYGLKVFVIIVLAPSFEVTSFWGVDDKAAGLNREAFSITPPVPQVGEW